MEKVLRRLRRLKHRHGAVKRLLFKNDNGLPTDAHSLQLRKQLAAKVVQHMSLDINTLIDAVTVISTPPPLPPHQSTVSNDVCNSGNAPSTSSVIVIDDDDDDDDDSGVAANTNNVSNIPEGRDEPVHHNIQFMESIRRCPICWEDMKTEHMVASSCSHWLCCECFKKLQSKRCPLCNVEMTMCIRYTLNGTNLCFSSEQLPTMATSCDFPDADLISDLLNDEPQDEVYDRMLSQREREFADDIERRLAEFNSYRLN